MKFCLNVVIEADSDVFKLRRDQPEWTSREALSGVFPEKVRVTFEPELIQKPSPA